MKIKFRLSAFTLAETLVTLMIIGVIASITIPGLKKSADSAKTVAQVKKAYSTLNSAISLAVQENGPTKRWGITGARSAEKSKIVMDNLAPYLNVMKKCDEGTGCFPDQQYVFLNGTLGDNINALTNCAKVKLTDGTAISFYNAGDNCNYSAGSSDELSHICGIFDIDINGDAKPNKVGIDFFSFYLTSEGVMALGTPGNTARPIAQCNITGSPCSGWIILKQNTDYLNKDVSW